MGRATPSLKLGVFALTVAVLGVLVGVAIAHEAAPAAAPSRPALPTPRPPLAPGEQRYIEALWPIHTRVERTAVRVALGASFYKLRDLSPADLKGRLDDALVAYRGAERQLRELQPPDSLRARHDAYLSAVQRFEASTLEMLRMYDDGSDDHLAQAFPMSLKGSDEIREVGESLWPDEYPPN